MASAAMAGWTEEASEADLDSHTPDMGDGDDSLDDQTVEEEQGEDIGYQQLLGRVFTSLDEDHPGLAERRSQPIFMPPNILREGTNTTVFINFMDTCERMHRQPKHVMDFLLSKLWTTGSLDEQQRLVVKGRFKPTAFEVTLRRYTKKYVICDGCKFPDTTLSRETHLLCGQCGSSRVVDSIEARFFPQVDRRGA